MTTNQPKFGPEQYAAGAVIFRQGDAPEKFYIITAGEVEVIRRGADGTEQVLNRLGPGDFFGEIGMLQWQRRLATLRAATAVSVMTMDRPTFRSWLSSSALVQAELTEVVQRRIGETPTLPAVEEELELPETAVLPLLPAPITAVSSSGPLHFDPGDTLIRQGDTADKFYILVSGRAEVLDESHGEERHLAYLDAGDYFGEIGLLEERARVATVRATTAVHVVAFDKAAFRRWLSKSPESANDLRQTMQERLNNRQDKQ